MRFLIRPLVPSLLALATLSCPPSALAQISAGSADDVCSPSTDPCIVDQEVLIQAGSFLDFGQRTLRIVEGGVLDFGLTAATVRSGRIEVEVDDDAVAIRASNVTPAEPSDQEFQHLEAVRECSGKPRVCFAETDCDLGTCDIRRCELEPARVCSKDGDCDLGVCSELGTCGEPPFSRCDTNSDCLKGPCGTALTCRGQLSPAVPMAAGPLECTSNADCELGDCTVGNGSIDLGGAVSLDIAFPHVFRIRAASDIRLGGKTEIESDGGYVVLEAELGNVEIDAPVRGMGERGASFQVFSGGNVAVDAPVEMNGNTSSDDVVVVADGDVLIHDDMTARTVEQRAHAGRVFVTSGKELRVEGGSAEDPLVLHAGFEAEPEPDTADGQGGFVVLDAREDLTIASDVELRVDGDFSLVGLSSAQDLDFQGSIEGSSYGDVSYGSRALLVAGRDLFLRSGSSVEIANEENNPLSMIWLTGDREVTLDGSLRLIGPVADQAIELPGVRIEGCSVRVGPNADVLNAAADSDNQIIARGRLTIEGGASWINEDNLNLARVRTGQIPVSLAGTIDPSLDIAIDATLSPCPNCETDCSTLDDGCFLGVCDEDTATCVTELVDGTPCDDADECTDSDECTGEVCMGIRDVACGDCGNETIEWGERCDDGNTAFVFGEACRTDCQWTGCGHPTGTTGTKPGAADALYVLRTAVDLEECDLSVCDANDSGAIETGDALLVLRAAVGLPAVSCPQPEI